MIIWLRNFKPVFYWIILILNVFLIPRQHIPDIPDFYQLFEPDKIVHVILYGVLLFLLLQSILKQYGRVFLRYKGTLIALFTRFFFGAITEYLQHILNINRSGNYYDFIANTIGCMLGLSVFFLTAKYFF